MLLYPIVYVSSVAAFELQGQNCVLVTETIWPVKLDIFTVWPFADSWTRQFGEKKRKKDVLCVNPVHLCLVHITVVPVGVTWGPLECWQWWGSRRSYFGGIELQLILLRVYCVNWGKVAKRMMAERTMSRALLRTEYNVEPSAPPCPQLWHGDSEGESPDACL